MYLQQERKEMKCLHNEGLRKATNIFEEKTICLKCNKVLNITNMEHYITQGEFNKFNKVFRYAGNTLALAKLTRLEPKKVLFILAFHSDLTANLGSLLSSQ